MWLLTCDGDLFAHKPLWLRPGSGHLLGRTTGRVEGGELVRYIDHKSVSRKHLIIHVGSVKPGDSSRVHVRSEIKIEEGSKVGTLINGEKISKTTKVLDKSEYTLKLGQYEHLFHLKWTPVVFTFHNLSKKEKAKSDPLEAYRAKLEQTDIKLIIEYVANTTTHVLATRRNTPVGLQALLQAQWLVTHSYVDAIANVTTRGDREINGEQQPSPLEQDFKLNWPNEGEYIPPAGGEPVPRPSELLKPNPERADIFAHFSFVFLSQSQYDLLMPVVTTGGGKAFLADVTVGETSVSSVVSQVKGIAGSKGNDDFKLSQYTGKGGVAVVRLADKNNPWTIDFLVSLDRKLEQRCMEQSEFLDAILTLNTGELRKPLEYAAPSQSATSQSGTSRRDTSQPQQATRQSRDRNDQQLPTPDSEQRQRQQPAEPEMAEPPRRKPRRVITQSRFKGFGEIDPSQFTFSDAEDAGPELSQAPSEQDMDVDETPRPSQAVQSQRASRKRPAPADGDIQQRERETLDNMLPGAAAMKRLKTQALQKEGRQNSVEPTLEPESTRGKTAASGLAALSKKKKEKQIDVRAELESRRRAEDEARQKDEEALREQLAGVDISTVHAVVETYEVPLRQPPSRRIDASGPSDRWDPAWNGRKNFKRFRPQGQHNDGPRLSRVIVTLEEVPRKSHGLGDDYWLDPPTASTRKSQSQSQSQAAGRPGSSEDDPNRFRRRTANSRIEDEEAAAREQIFPEDVAGRPRNRAIQEAIDSTPSQTLGTDSQRRAAGKRAAERQDGPTTKKARAAPPSRQARQVAVDEDEDDGLKFRRRRK